jgi:predicted permease
MFLLLMLLIPRIEKENPRRGVMVQAIFRSNFVLYGLPVATSICGEAHIGPTSLLISFVVPTYNVLAVVCLEWFRGGKPDGKKILRGIATNPLIIASVLGVAANLLKLPLPSGAQKCITDLGRVATPLSLVALGADFKFNKVRGITGQLTLCVLGKLVIAPLVMVTPGILMGFRGDYLVPVLVMFGAPSAVSSYTMAQQMNGDGTLAASVVVFTTAFSILTIFLWVFFLKQLAFI